MGWIDDKGQYRRDDEPNAAEGYQDPLYPQPSNTIIPAAQLAANPAQRIDPTAPENPTLVANRTPEPAASLPSTQTDGAPQSFSLPGAAPMLPPTRTMQTEGTSATVSGMDRASKKAIQKADAEQDVVDQQAAATTRQAGGVARADAQDAAAVAKERQQMTDQRSAEQERVIAEGDAAKQRAEQIYRDELDRYRKLDVKDFFRDDPRGERQAWAAMTVALGGLGTALQQASGVNAQNDAAANLDRLIERDFRQQKENILKQREVVGLTRQDADRTRADQLHALHLLEIRTAAKEEALGNKMAAMLASRGVDKATIAENQAIQALARSSAERHARVAQSTANHFQTTTQRRLVEQQGGMTGTAGAGMRPDHALFGPGGQVVGYAPDKERAAKINEANAGARDAVGIIAKLRQNFEKYGNELTLWSDAGKERESLRDSLSIAIKKAGQNSDLDQEILRSLVASDWDLKWANTSRLDALAARLSGTIDNNLDSVGVRGKDVGQVIRGEAKLKAPQVPQANDQELAHLVTRAQRGDAAAVQALRNLGMMR